MTDNKARQSWPIHLFTDHQLNLFVQVVLAGLPPSDALFLCYVFPRMRQEENLNATQLGNVAHMTTGAALYHLKRLATRDFVKRDGHRAWNLGPRSLD